MSDDPKWQAFLDWSKSPTGWDQQRLAEEVVTNRAHLNQVLTGKRTGGQTWRRVVKVLPMEGLLLLQQCAAWNKFAAAALAKRLADEADAAVLQRLGEKCRQSTPVAALLLFFVLWFMPSPAHADEFSAQLAATAQVETPHGVHRGKKGEWTKYQFLPATWARFSKVSMLLAPPEEVERVARCVLREIGQELDRQKLPRDAHNYALRWNAGARAKQFTVETWNYATRVANLVEVAR